MANGNGVWKWVSSLLGTVIITGLGSYFVWGSTVNRAEFKELTIIVQKLAESQTVAATNINWLIKQQDGKGGG